MIFLILLHILLLCLYKNDTKILKLKPKTAKLNLTAILNLTALLTS